MADERFDPAAFLDFEHTAHGDLFAEGEPVWSALSRIKPYLADAITSQEIGTASVSDRAEIGPHVRLGEGTVVEPFATIKGPAWIGPNCTIRCGAYIRENVIAGEGVMFGNSCEFKNCLLFDHAEIPHFNYVGDSVLGYKAHLGAGVILSNVRLDRRNVRVATESEQLESGLRKFGAIIGDRTEVGCNSVLSPGSVVGRDCILYPGSQWRGYLPSNRIAKVRLEQLVVPRNG
tara:strand:+ start:17503 stop:18198 length:696 start_codon:yes stop_codon:yes gene_type:complete